jgi:hypothetical protein
LGESRTLDHPTTEERAVPFRNAKKKISGAADDARDSIVPVAQSAVDRAESAAHTAIEKLAPVAQTAVDRAESAAGSIGSAAQDAVSAVVSAVGPVLSDAAIKVGVKDKPKKKHRIRKLLVTLGLVGAAAFVFKKVTRGKQEPEWISGRDAAGDVGKHTAGEDKSDTAPTAPLASEETVESHTPTTPDEPLEENAV